MKFKNLILLTLVTIVTSCSGSGVRHTLGISRDAPDEFLVLPRGELIVPDQAIALPAPTKKIAGNLAASDNARKALYGTEAVQSRPNTAAEQALLVKTGANKAKSSIRNIVEDEYEEKSGVFGTDRGGWMESVLDPFGYNAPVEPVVDGKAENKRIKAAIAKGQKIDTAHVKTIDPREEKWNGKKEDEDNEDKKSEEDNSDDKIRDVSDIEL